MLKCLLACPNLPVSFPIATPYLTGVEVAKKDAPLKIIWKATWIGVALSTSKSVFTPRKAYYGGMWVLSVNHLTQFLVKAWPQGYEIKPSGSILAVWSLLKDSLFHSLCSSLPPLSLSLKKGKKKSKIMVLHYTGH